MPATSKSPRVCETCGSPIEATSSGDLGYMVCLIDTALDPDAEQSEVAFASALDQLGAYTIERHVDGSAWELGHGAMGVTYRAIDKVLDRPVALKIINTDLGSRSAEARERFMREARAAAALRHPNVATIYQFGIREETGQFFYAMELVEGETLEERVRRLGPLDVLTTIDMALQVTAALAAAEKHGLVHRDLKPANLMLVSPEGERVDGNRDAIVPSTATQRRGYNAAHAVAASLRRGADRNDEKLVVKVIDFGVAKAVAEKTNAMALTHGGFVGTPAFASPEQFANAPVDVRSDIYSLGATLWFLLTGHMPFSGRTVEEIRDARRSKPLPIEQLKAARVPRRLVALLMSMLAIEPAARPAGAAELNTKLQKIRASITDRRKIATRFAVAAAVIFVLGVSAFFVFHSLRTHPAAAGSAWNPATPEKSIAVLPFENLSRDPDNAYFADGIQEEILTRLAGIGDLKVISRSSTQRYQSKPRNLGEIARQLGVANILEGSVQKAADQVRVNVQLINAQTDSHLWADTYDRKLTDILGVESEIAKGIAESLQAKLTGREEQALAVKPTNNPEAYDAYLRGLAFQARSNSPPLSWKAVGFYERAVQLDPNFALAWARLSREDARLYFNRFDTTTAARGDAAKSALENAQKLDPNSPETLLALGYYQYWVLRDYGLAKTTFARVSKTLPRSSEVPFALGLVTRREGHWDESIAYVEQALTFDPRNLEILMDAATTYRRLRQFPAALKLYDRVLDITPNDPDVMAEKASVYQAEGNLPEAAKLLAEVNAQATDDFAFQIKITQLRLERNYGEAVRLLRARLAQFHFASEYNKALEQVRLALMQHVAGDTAGAKVSAEQARNTLEQLYRDQPDNYLLAARLSQDYAVLGEKDSALREAQRAIMLLPRAKDALVGSTCEANLAFIQTIVGENRRAISTLGQLLKTPLDSWIYPMTLTPALLSLDPIWDPLRADPAFQKLCEEKIDKSIAVLPFENLSADPENAFFTVGVQDEILNDLAKMADLKVISRTSAMQYKTGVKRNLREIANELGVAHVVEGSVQRVANRVRVSAQLIDARNDTHVWVEKYDRDLADVFAIQSEIAQKIADQLQAKLSPKVKEAIMERPTKDLAAYDLYLRAKQLIYDSEFDSAHRRENHFKAVQLLDQAILRDPAFFLAHCQLAYLHDQIYLYAFDHTETRLALAETSVKAAVRLEPESGDTHLAQASHFYWGYLNYDRAREELAKAQRALPNNTRIFEILGLIDRRQGRWDEAIRNFERAEDLDPRNAITIYELGLTYSWLRKYKEAIAMFNRALALEPRSINLRTSPKWDVLRAQADMAPLRAVVNTIEAEGPSSAAEVAEDSFNLAIYERDPVAAAHALANIPKEGDARGLFENSHAWYEGLLSKLLQDVSGAHSAFTAARVEAEKTVRAQPGNVASLNVLARIDALLGDKEKAIQEGRAACDMLPLAKDAVVGVTPITNLARIYALTGEKDLAIQQLEIVSKLPAGPSYGGLRLDPQWDSLRGDPRFDKIVASLAPK